MSLANVIKESNLEARSFHSSEHMCVQPVKLIMEHWLLVREIGRGALVLQSSVPVALLQQDKRATQLVVQHI
jgi:hypothetical protein